MKALLLWQIIRNIYLLHTTGRAMTSTSQLQSTNQASDLETSWTSRTLSSGFTFFLTDTSNNTWIIKPAVFFPPQWHIQYKGNSLLHPLHRKRIFYLICSNIVRSECCFLPCFILYFFLHIQNKTSKHFLQSVWTHNNNDNERSAERN